MNPLEEYNTIISNRQQNPLSKEIVGEFHHIKPRCLGGGDNAENMVKLTLQEHYRCHCLLPKIYTEGIAHDKLVFAWNQMQGRMPTGDIDKDAEEYARLKMEFIEATKRMPHPPRSEETKIKISKSHTGKPKPWLKGKTPWNKGLTGLPSHRKGFHHTEETKKLLSEKIQKITKGKPKPWLIGRHHTEEWKQNMSSKLKGRPKSEETKRNMSAAKTEELRKQVSEKLKAYWAARKAVNQ